MAVQGKRDECYETRLRIQRVEMNDARHYYLTVENDKGSDSFYVTLTVKGMPVIIIRTFRIGGAPFRQSALCSAPLLSVSSFHIHHWKKNA